MTDGEVAVTFLRNLKAEPWRFDYFTVLRHLERTCKDSPRISDSASAPGGVCSIRAGPLHGVSCLQPCPCGAGRQPAAEAFVKFSVCLDRKGRCRLRPPRKPITSCLPRRMLFRGFSIYSTIGSSNCSFAPGRIPGRSCSMIGRPQTALSPIGSAIGLGSRPYQNLDSVPDAVKLGFAGLVGLAGQMRLPACRCRLRHVQRPR